MTAKRFDITIEQGADFSTPFPITDQYGHPLDLTAAALQIRTDSDDPTALLSLDTTNSGLTIDLTARVIAPFVGREVTAAILKGRYVYDLLAQYQSGDVFKLYSGSVFVVPRVTIYIFGPAPAPAPSPSPSPSPAPSPAPAGQLNFSIAGNSGLAAGAM